MDEKRSFFISNLRSVLRAMYADASSAANLQEHPVRSPELRSLRHGRKWRRDCASIAAKHPVKSDIIFVKDFIEFWSRDGLQVGIGQVVEIVFIAAEDQVTAKTRTQIQSCATWFVLPQTDEQAQLYVRLATYVRVNEDEIAAVPNEYSVVCCMSSCAH